MSIVLTTDIFCDGDGCCEWTEGVTGPVSRAKLARAEARRHGWKTTRHGDFCPRCQKREVQRDD